eukprot:3042423-Amphidinium_carterae.1
MAGAKEEHEKGPSKWDGSEETWQEWRFEFINWARRHRQDAPMMLQAACDAVTVTDVQNANMDAEARVLAGKIMTDLALKTVGPAKRLLMSMQESDNGFLGFRELARRAESGTGLRATSLLSSILRFDFSGKDFRDKLVQFESLVNQYEAQQGPDGHLADSVRIALVANGSTGELRRQLHARTSSFADYPAMRRFVLDFLDAQRIYGGPNASKLPRGQTRDDPMDIDGAFADPWKGKGKDKGKDKGKGKGKQKGKEKGKEKGAGKSKGKEKEKEKPFQGYCGTCGRWGHKSAACYYNSANGKSGRPAGSAGGNGKGKANQESADGSVATLFETEGWVFSIQAHEEEPVDPTEQTVDVVVDSGASRSATQWGFGHGDISAGQAGPVLRSVDWIPIRQFGERCMRAVVTDTEGQSFPIALRSVVAEVSKNVLSVESMNEAGNALVFPAWGRSMELIDGETEVELSVPCIIRADSSRVVPLQRKNGVFVLPMRASQGKAEDELLGAMNIDEGTPDPPPGLATASTEGMAVGTAVATAEVRRPTVQLGSRPVHIIPETAMPDEATVRHHLATGHAEYAPWCESCTGGRGREAKHSRIDPSQRHTPHVYLDYGYFTYGGGPKAQRMSDVRYSVFLVATDNSSGEVFGSIVKRKGRGELYTAAKLALWLERLGHPKVIMVTDTEAPMRSMAKAIIKELRKRVNFQVMLRAVPRGSSASNGPAEQSVQLVASSVRTLLWDLGLAETVEPNDRVLTWLVPYCAWCHNRFSPDSNGITPYEKATGQKYTGSVVPWGSWVMFKHDKPTTKHRSKLRSLCSLSIWLGKSELNDSHFVSTKSGARTGRTVRAVPKPRATALELKHLKGVPWNVTEGADEPDVVEEQPMNQTDEPTTQVEASDDDTDADGVSASDNEEGVVMYDGVTGMEIVQEAPSSMVQAAQMQGTAEAVAVLPDMQRAEQIARARAREREVTSIDRVEERPSQVARIETPRGMKRTRETGEVASPPSWRRVGHERYEVERQPMTEETMEGPTMAAEAMQGQPAASATATTETTTATASVVTGESEQREGLMNGMWHETWLTRTRVELHEYTESCDAVVCTVFETDRPSDGETPNLDVSPAERSLMADTTLWEEEPETSAIFRPLTPDEIWKARLDDLAKIAEFQALSPFQRQSALDTPDALWLTARWVDVRKNEGEARSRWVLREFNGNDGELDYFSATPDAMIVEAVHAYALKHGKDILYADISRAFMHAPQEQWVFVEPPQEAYAEEAPESIRVKQGEVYVCKRNINGRRDGPKAYQTYSQLAWQSLGFEVSKMHPSVVYESSPRSGVMPDIVCMHVDDWIMAVEPDRTESLVSELQVSFVVKESGRLPAHGTKFSPWCCSWAGKGAGRETCCFDDLWLSMWSRHHMYLALAWQVTQRRHQLQLSPCELGQIVSY